MEWVGCGKWCTFNLLRNCQMIFQSDCITLHFHQQRMSSSGSTCCSTLCVLGLLNSRDWAPLHVFLCYPYIFFAKVLVQSLTFLLLLLVGLISSHSGYILGTSQKIILLGINSFVSLACGTRKTKLSATRKEYNYP